MDDPLTTVTRQWPIKTLREVPSILVLHDYEIQRKDVSLTFLNYNLSGSHFPWMTPENRAYAGNGSRCCEDDT